MQIILQFYQRYIRKYFWQLQNSKLILKKDLTLIKQNKKLKQRAFKTDESQGRSQNTSINPAKNHSLSIASCNIRSV